MAATRSNGRKPRKTSKATDEVAILRRVIAAVIADDQALALAELTPIAGLTIRDKPIVRFEPKLGPPVAIRPGFRSPPLNRFQTASTFARDSFTCLYCARRAIPQPILRLLSIHFGDALAWETKWRATVIHRLYWDLAASVDHITPTIHGGEPYDMDNLATACYRCQQQKGNALGWPADKRPKRGWDGFTKSLEPLWHAVGQPRGHYVSWAREFREARERLRA